MKNRKILKVILIIITITIVYLAAATIFAEIMFDSLGFIGHFDYESLHKAEDYGFGSRERDLMTSDGIKIHIYETTLDNPNGVVIMLTGITGPSVTAFYGQAQLVSELGFEAVMVDARGHGLSGGDKISLGVGDIKDVEAVTDYIRKKPGYEDLPIIVMGLSMGGATAINSGCLNDEISGIIALSPFSSWSDVCVDNVETIGFPRWVGELFKPGVWIHGFLNHGKDFFVITPENCIEQAGDTPILIMRSAEDPIAPLSNQERLNAHYTGNNMTVVVRDGAWHHVVLEDNISDPFDDTEYCETILTFLKQFIEQETDDNVGRTAI